MLRSFCKYQRHFWLKNWAALNNRTDNFQQCETQQLLQKAALPCVRDDFENQEYKNENETKHKCGLDIDGFWFGSCHFQFWEAVGVGTAIVAGIRFTIEHEKRKRHEGSQEQMSWMSHFILNPLHKSKILFFEGSRITCFWSKSFDLRSLAQFVNNNNYGVQMSVLPPTDRKQKLLYAVVEQPRNEEIKINEKSSDVDSQKLSPTNVTQADAFPSFYFTHLSPNDSTSAFQNPTPPSHSSPTKGSTLAANESRPSSSDSFGTILNLLDELQEELFSDEKSKIAAKLARRGEFKRATEIWNQILRLHPGHTMSLYNLAVCYENGLWLERNIDEAMDLYKKAADKSHPRSCYRLSRIHLHMYRAGSATSHIIYYEYLSKAAAGGLEEAKRELDALLQDKGSSSEHESLRKAASDKGELSSYCLPDCKTTLRPAATLPDTGKCWILGDSPMTENDGDMLPHLSGQLSQKMFALTHLRTNEQHHYLSISYH